MSGVINPNGGKITIAGEEVFDNPRIKGRIVFVPDELYYFSGSTMADMAGLYRAAYDRFSDKRFKELSEIFELSKKVKINSLSKGMKRQVGCVLALSCMADYYFVDETFDGLDAVMRTALKRILFEEVSERNATVVLTSHSLRELEDTCDKLALLHKGGIILENDVQTLGGDVFKIQIAFNGEFDERVLQEIRGMEIFRITKVGSVATFVAKGEKEHIKKHLNELSPAFLDILPLDLEEYFLYQMDALGYNKKTESKS
jgi:ABC-2 type transport system ATP-binding protein